MTKSYIARPYPRILTDFVIENCQNIMKVRKLLRYFKRLLLIFGTFVLILCLLIIGGYIYTLFHGGLTVSIRDVSSKGIYDGVLGAQIHFHDDTGNVVGSGYTDEKLGAVFINYPEFGSCADNVSEREKWYACSSERSRWIVKFAKKISSISVETAECQIERIPVHVKVARSEALTYWMPLPHVMGKPLTYFFIHHEGASKFRDLGLHLYFRFH